MSSRVTRQSKRTDADAAAAAADLPSSRRGRKKTADDAPVAKVVKTATRRTAAGGSAAHSPPSAKRTGSAGSAPHPSPAHTATKGTGGSAGAAVKTGGKTKRGDDDDEEARKLEYERKLEQKYAEMSDKLPAGDKKFKTAIGVKEALRQVILSSRASGILFLNVSARVLGIIHESNDKDGGEPYPIIDGRVVAVSQAYDLPPATPFDDFCYSIRDILAGPELEELALCALGTNESEVMVPDYVMTKVGENPVRELPLGQNLVLAMAKGRPGSTKFSHGDDLFINSLEVAGFISYRPHTDKPGKLFIADRPPKSYGKLFNRLQLAMNASKVGAHNRGPYPYNRVLDLDVVCTSTNREGYKFTGRKGANILGNMLVYTLLKEFSQKEEGDFKYMAVYVKLILYDANTGQQLFEGKKKGKINPLYPILRSMGFVDCTTMTEPPLDNGEQKLDFLVLVSNKANKPLGGDAVVMNRLLSKLRGDMDLSVGGTIIPFSDICPDKTVCR
jgi:hypothetical protein